MYQNENPGASDWDPNFLSFSATLENPYSLSWIYSYNLFAQDLNEFVTKAELEMSKIHSNPWAVEFYTNDKDIYWKLEGRYSEFEEFFIGIKLSENLFYENSFTWGSKLSKTELDHFIDQCRIIVDRYPVK